MMRLMVLLSALLGACTVGEVPGTDGGGMNPGTANREICAERSTNILPAHNHVAAGADPAGPRARSGCMDAACHAMGGAGGVFAFAGTVYKETAAVTPATGVTVRIFKPGNDKSLAEAITDDAGNFVIRTAPVPLTDFPYDTDVTACGTSPGTMGIKIMVSKINAVDANCNLGGTCHGATGGQGAVFLPDI